MSRPQPENLCWLDLETTGLDPFEDAVLELGMVITTPGLTEVARKAWVFEFDIVKVLDQDPASIHERVLNMHHENDLWEECSVAKGSCFDLQHEFIAFLEQHKAVGGPLCGSTVSFDRSFLKIEAPKFEKCFNHRHIDASSLLEFSRFHNKYRPRPDGGHRVLADIENSICTWVDYFNSFRHWNPLDVVLGCAE